MAIATAYQAINMNESPYFNVTSATINPAYTLITQYGTGERQEFDGSFTFNGTMVTGGTVTGTRHYTGSSLDYSITGVSIPVATLNTYLEYDDLRVFEFVFRFADTFNGSPFSDTAYSHDGNDAVHGNGGNDVLYGGNGNDRMWGDAGNDFGYGGLGNDQLWGGAGNDVGYGEAGADVLYGGKGKDTMTGGADADRFIFNGAAPGAIHADTITDFVVGADKLQLDDAMFDGIGGLGNVGSRFFKSAGAGVNSANDADCRVIYNTTTGNLYFDADGQGGASAVLFATLTGSPDGLSGLHLQVI